MIKTDGTYIAVYDHGKVSIATLGLQSQQMTRYVPYLVLADTNVYIGNSKLPIMSDRRDKFDYGYPEPY